MGTQLASSTVIMALANSSQGRLGVTQALEQGFQTWGTTMRFGITLGKTVIATLDVSETETVTNRAGEPIAYRTRSHDDMFQRARHLANGCGVYPMDKVHHHA